MNGAGVGSKKPIVVLHSSSDWLGQTKAWLYDQVIGLPETIESHVVCEDKRNLDQFPIAHLHTLGEEYPIRAWWNRKLKAAGLRDGLNIKLAVIRKTKAEIVHSHFGYQGWTDWKIVRRAGVKHAVSFYGVDVNKIPQQDSRWLTRYREMFDNAAAVFCEGRHMAACVSSLGCPPHKIRVQHLGISTGNLAFQPRIRAADEPLRVLMCASFTEKKGLPYALRAIAEAARDFPLEATLIGGNTGSPEHEKESVVIQDLLQSDPLKQRVRMIGYQPLARVVEEAYRHHVFLSPSVTASDGDTEGGAPTTIALMAATGMPVISTFHCDIPEVVEHGNSALLAPERDTHALVDCLKRLFENPHLSQSLGATARKRMEEEFDREKQGVKLAESYREILSA